MAVNVNPLPSLALGSSSQTCFFSKDSLYLVILASASPYINIYKRTGNSLTKLAAANITGAALGSAGNGRGGGFSYNNKYFGFGGSTGTGPNTSFSCFYKNNGDDTFTRLAGSTTASACFGVSFHPSQPYVAVNTSAAPYIEFYSINTTTDAFTKMTLSITGAPTQVARSVRWSPDGNYVVFSVINTPYLFKVVISGNTITLTPVPFVANPSYPSPAGTGFGIAWHFSSKYFVAAFNSSTSGLGTLIFKIAADGLSFTRLAPLDQLGVNASNAYSIDWSSDGRYIYSSGAAGAYLIWSFYIESETTSLQQNITLSGATTIGAVTVSPDGTTYAIVVQTSNTSNWSGVNAISDNIGIAQDVNALPTVITSASGVFWSKDSKYCVILANASPFIYVFSRVGNVFTRIAAANITGAVFAANGKNGGFSRENKYFVVGSASTGNFAVVYRNNGDDTFTRLTTPQPANTVYCETFSPAINLLAISYANTAPYLMFQKYDTSTDTFTNLTLSFTGTATLGIPYGLKFSADGKFLLVGLNGGGNYQLFKITTNFTANTISLTLVAAPSNDAALTNVSCWSVDFHPTSKYMAVFPVAATGGYIYTIASDGNSYTYLATLDSTQDNTATWRACSFSADGKYLIAVDSAGQLYSWVITTATNSFVFHAISSYPSAGTSGQALGLSPDSQFMAVAAGSPTIYYLKPYGGGAFTYPVTIAGVNVSNKDRELTLDIATHQPAVLPTQFVQGLEWSPDGKFLAVSTAGTGAKLLIYSRVGDVLTKLTIASLPEADGRNLSWTGNSQYLAVAMNATPFLAIYKNNAGTFTRLDVSASVSFLKQASSATFSPDGRMLIMGLKVAPFYQIYKFDSIAGVLDQLPLSSPLDSEPLAAVGDVRFSGDGQFITMAFGVAPYVSIWQRVNNNYAFVRVATPDKVPTGAATSCDFSSDGKQIAVGFTTTPFMYIYKFTNGNTLTARDDPTGLPPGNVLSIRFTINGKYLAIAHTASPYATLYVLSGNTSNQRVAPSTLPAVGGERVAWTPDISLLAVGSDAAGYLTLLKSKQTEAYLFYPSYNVASSTKLPNKVKSGSLNYPVRTMAGRIRVPEAVFAKSAYPNFLHSNSVVSFPTEYVEDRAWIGKAVIAVEAKAVVPTSQPASHPYGHGDYLLSTFTMHASANIRVTLNGDALFSAFALAGLSGVIAATPHYAYPSLTTDGLVHDTDDAPPIRLFYPAFTARSRMKISLSTHDGWTYPDYSALGLSEFMYATGNIEVAKPYAMSGLVKWATVEAATLLSRFKINGLVQWVQGASDLAYPKPYAIHGHVDGMKIEVDMSFSKWNLRGSIKVDVAATGIFPYPSVSSAGSVRVPIPVNGGFEYPVDTVSGLMGVRMSITSAISYPKFNLALLTGFTTTIDIGVKYAKYEIENLSGHGVIDKETKIEYPLFGVEVELDQYYSLSGDDTVHAEIDGLMNVKQSPRRLMVLNDS